MGKAIVSSFGVEGGSGIIQEEASSKEVKEAVVSCAKHQVGMGYLVKL